MVSKFSPGRPVADRIRQVAGERGSSVRGGLYAQRRRRCAALLLPEHGMADDSIDPSVSRPAAGLGLALTAFSAATFGFGTTFARLAYDGGSDPLTIVLLRTAVFVIAVGLGLALLRRLARLGRRPFVATLWMAVTLAVVALGYQGSVAYIPVGLAALIFYSFPLMVGLIAMAAGRDRL